MREPNEGSDQPVALGPELPSDVPTSTTENAQAWKVMLGLGLALAVVGVAAPEYRPITAVATGAIALTGSTYFLGFVVGCLVIPAVVARVAHIRTFMVMGALATVALGTSRLGPVRPGVVNPGVVNPGVVSAGDVRPGEVSPGDVRLGVVEPVPVSMP